MCGEDSNKKESLEQNLPPYLHFGQKESKHMYARVMRITARNIK